MTKSREPVEPKKHAKYSASGAKRWQNCPGSPALSAKAPPQRDSEYAAEGTRAHECVEAFLKNPTKNVETKKFLLKSYPRDMVEHGEAAYLAIYGEYLKRKGAALLCETKIDLGFVAEGVTKEKMFGTVDAAIVEEFGELTVYDYKYGAGIPVDPDNNEQLIYYALGLAHKYDYNFEIIRLVIIQPRADHEKGPVREWTCTVEHLESWRELFRDGVKACEDPKAPLVPGSHCRFCPAMIICPGVSDQALASARIDFAPSSETGLALPSPNFPLPENLKNLGAVLTALAHVEKWTESVREYAFNHLKGGHPVPGYKLVQKRATRKWADVASVEDRARVLFGPKAFTAPELLSPAQLEKACEAKDFVAKYSAAESSGVTLAPEHDKRPAVTPATSDFDVVDVDVDVVDLNAVKRGELSAAGVPIIKSKKSTRLASKKSGSRKGKRY